MEFNTNKTYNLEIKINKIPEIKLPQIRTYEPKFLDPNKDSYFSPSRMRERSFELQILRDFGVQANMDYRTSPFKTY